MLHAVIVGVNKYADPEIPDLNFAAQDASTLADLCRKSRFADDIVTQCLIDEDATRSAILHLIGTELAFQTGRDDTILFFFAGHGSPETAPGTINASRFLACHDTGREQLFATGIDVSSDLVRVAKRLPAGLIIFILDACFSGYSGGRGFVGPTLESYRRERRAGLRLSSIDLGTGVVYMAAAADTEVAWEDNKFSHGVFSYYLFEQLTSVGSEGTIGLATLYDRVYSNVLSYSSHRQHPVLWGNVTGARFPLLGQGEV